MKKILVFAVFMLSFYTALYAQNNPSQSNPLQNNSSGIFSKVWAYPDIPDQTIKKNLIEIANAPGCQIPPEGQRTFGNIRGMGFDKGDNLYVWDDGYQALLKFTPDGKLSWRKKYAKDGKAEGTFSMVGPAFAISDDGLVCLGDKTNKTISLLDSSGNYIRRFKVEMMPASITFGKDGSIYVTGFGFTYKGDLVQHYSATGEFMGAFCGREPDSKAIDWSGNSGHLSTDNEGNIYYSHFYPYRVEKFSKDGKLLKYFVQARDNFDAPMFSNRDASRTVLSPSGLRGLTYIPQGYLAIMVQENSRENKWSMDIMDLEGTLKATLSKTEFPVGFSYRCSACDSKGNLYYDLCDSTDPLIIKYSVNYNAILK